MDAYLALVHTGEAPECSLLQGIISHRVPFYVFSPFVAKPKQEIFQLMAFSVKGQDCYMKILA